MTDQHVSDFRHHTRTGKTMQYERPDYGGDRAHEPECPEHGRSMVLVCLDERMATPKQLKFECPEQGCNEKRWKE